MAALEYNFKTFYLWFIYEIGCGNEMKYIIIMIYITEDGEFKLNIYKITVFAITRFNFFFKGMFTLIIASDY